MNQTDAKTLIELIERINTLNTSRSAPYLPEPKKRSISERIYITQKALMALARQNGYSVKWDHLIPILINNQTGERYTI